MSSKSAAEVISSDLSALKTKKSKKKRSGKNKPNGESQKSNGVVPDETHGDEVELEEGESQPSTEPPTPTSDTKLENSIRSPYVHKIDTGNNGEIHHAAAVDQAAPAQRVLRRISLTQRPKSVQTSDDHSEQPAPSSHQDSTTGNSVAMLEALTQERETLRDEVSQVRKSLEEFQAKHENEVSSVREELHQTQNGKEQAESQYRNLLGKVNTIRSQLGDRLKADAEDLTQARARIEELEEHTQSLKEQNESRETEVAALAEQMEQQSKELSSLRNRTLLSQENFGKERAEFLQREATAKEDFEAAKQAMQDWEILAMEERSVRESMQEKVSDLEEQISSHREAYERAAEDRDTQSSTVDGLQRALQELQDGIAVAIFTFSSLLTSTARRRELRDMVENTQFQIETLQKQLHKSEHKASEASTKLESVQRDLEQALPFEKEVKEKNLLIGKLRHEAVILNDHLTKALRHLRKGKPEDTIDKQLITNHFMHFLAIDRADSKKFEVLQIIASLLAWNEEQREQAGLARPGASNPIARVPVSPWHRTPSTPSLSTDYVFDHSTRKDSLADLWSDFLQHEAQEDIKSPKSPSSNVPSSSASSKPP
ncbi:uncharacterized protein KY384_006917 [Bacidia gigantensis]|uniref:uncharacterized protein n=1 Tax=Bacidia gigantensis TaxID=2732470 RepID=UPI001D056899|nr:uncharacterized protein KY384_006917 [Bacidia gigantensis]KAG8528001.1 hypothetical protein KY384_006917 [Bacidia gigantensis]